MTQDNSKQSSPYGMLTDAHFAHILEYLRQNPRAVMEITKVRVELAASRIRGLSKDNLRIFDSPTGREIANTVDHNIDSLLNLGGLIRPQRLIDPLKSIHYVIANIAALKVLSIGPRSDAELFGLLAAGFEPQNITGLDLIAYSDWVNLGDMHAMPYQDNSFDVVMLGWVLAYSADVQSAVNEVLRVARPGAHIAIGWEYSPLSNEELASKDLTDVSEATRVRHSSEILAYFDGHVDDVIFKSDVHPDLANQTSDVIVVFRLKK